MKYPQFMYRIVIISIFSLFACKTAEYTNAPKPAEQYTPANAAPPVPSRLTIPINISIQDLAYRVNTVMPQVLYEDLSFSDNNNDGLMLKAVKSQDVTLHFSGNLIKYRIPLKLWMKQNLYVTDAEGTGELALNLKTSFSINPDWTLSTKTEVEFHEWISKPVLKTGLGNIGVEGIANLVLNSSKKTLAKTLDRTVSQQINLRPFVEEAWMALQEPVLLSEEFQMWVKTTPVSIGITPITTDWNYLKAKVSVETLNDVTFGAKPAFRQNTSLPYLTIINEAPDDFQVRIATDVPFSEAERLAKITLQGQEFSSGKKKVKIEDLQLWGSGDKVVVNAQLSGSFKGNIYFIGRPQVNMVKNQVEISDLDYHVDTRNFLLKSASWLFQGLIRKKMADAMAFPLEENLTDLKKSIQETLNHYEIDSGVLLTGQLDQIFVENTQVTPQGILVNLFGQGRVQVEVK